MSVRELGRRLGMSPSLVSRLVRKGMPTEEEAARAWRVKYVRRLSNSKKRPARFPVGSLPVWNGYAG